MATSMDKYEDSASSQLSALGSATKALSTEGTRPDVSDGSTPRKRSWEYVDDWQLTASREDILKVWRTKGLSAVGSETFIAEHLPLPDDESSAEAVNEEESEVDASTTERVDSPSIPSTALSPVSLPDSPPPPPRSKLPARGKGKSAQAAVLPAEPLVDSRSVNVYMTRGSRRHIR